LLPINLSGILAKYDIKNNKKTNNLDKKYIFEKVKKLLEHPDMYIGAVPEDSKMLKILEQPEKVLLDLYLLTSLSPSKVINDYKLNKKQFDDMIEIIRDTCLMALIQPGTAVGIIAAQSMGAQITQMTLNTFHLSGIKSTEALGMKRANEVIGLMKKQKTPSMSLPLFNNVNPNNVLNRMTFNVLSMFVKGTEILYDVDHKIFKTSNVKPFMKYNDEVDSTCYFKLVLDKYQMVDKNINILDIQQTIAIYIAAKKYDQEYVTKKQAQDIFGDAGDNIFVYGNGMQDSQPIVYIRMSFSKDIEIDITWLIKMKNKRSS
jgi:DNA-directed RNA polymerase II subunit RPB1